MNTQYTDDGTVNGDADESKSLSGTQGTDKIDRWH